MLIALQKRQIVEDRGRASLVVVTKTRPEHLDHLTEKGLQMPIGDLPDYNSKRKNPTLKERLGLHCLDIEGAPVGLERDQAVWRSKRLQIDLLRALRAGHPNAWEMLKRLELAKLNVIDLSDWMAP